MHSIAVMFLPDQQAVSWSVREFVAQASRVDSTPVLLLAHPQRAYSFTSNFSLASRP